MIHLQHFKSLFFLVIGVAIRYFLIKCSYQRSIANRVEISTPINSWKRVVEGVTLLNLGISPYDGDTFHELPLFLYFYRFINLYLKEWIPLIFSITDVVTGLMLSAICNLQLHQIIKWETHKLSKLEESDVKKLKISEKSISELSFRVLIIYILLPYSILACAALSTSVFTNFLTASTILTATLGWRIFSLASAALLAYQSLYPIALIIPVVMVAEKVNFRNDITSFSYGIPKIICSMTWSILSFTLIVIALIQISYYKMDSAAFISSTYWFMLSVPDFTPNIGIFWYFFTEMFDQFRDFFLWTFQINSFIYFFPISLILRDNPNFIFMITLMLLSLFKPYPSISDAALFIALLPQWTFLFPYLRQAIYVSASFVACTVLAPLMWHMWIILGTANSNYYFGVTLAYNLSQIFLVTDLLFAYMKRNFFLENGIKTGEDGKPLRLELVSE